MRIERASGRARETGRGVARRSAWLAAALLATLPPPGGAAGMATVREVRDVPLRDLAPRIGSTVPVRQLPDGVAVDVDGFAPIFLPLPGTSALEIEYRARGPLLLTWFTAEGTTTPAPHTTPWHHLQLEPGPGSASLDLRATPLWSGERTPVLFLEGTGAFELTRLRAVPAPAGRDAQVRERDEALREAPLWIGHTTIHFSDPPPWRASRGVLLLEVLGAGFLVAAVGGSLGWLALRRRWAPAAFVAGAALAATALANAAFLRRAWPALALRPAWTPEARLTRNLHMSPELGALAALARRTLPEADRVGIQVREGDWFAWETLCFHLAPRTCVRVVPGRSAYEGLYGVDRLAPGDLDALVYFHADPPPLPGFVPAAAVGPRSLVARRP